MRLCILYLVHSNVVSERGSSRINIKFRITETDYDRDPVGLDRRGLAQWHRREAPPEIISTSMCLTQSPACLPRLFCYNLFQGKGQATPHRTSAHTALSTISGGHEPGLSQATQGGTDISHPSLT